MAARPAPRPRSGADPEHARHTVQRKLRLPPDVDEDLVALASRWRITVSGAVAKLVERAIVEAEIRDEMGG